MVMAEAMRAILTDDFLERPCAPEAYKQSEFGPIPNDWDIRPLLSAANIVSGQVDPREEPYRSMILIAPDHIESGTGRLLTKRTAGEQRAISGKYFVHAGDIIYSKIRPNLKKVTCVDFDCLCSADMYALTPVTGIARGYLAAILLGEHFTNFAVSVSVRSGMPKINREELSQYSCPFPSAEREQQAIAEALADADGFIDKLEQIVVKKRQIKQGAMQELLSGRKRLPGFAGEWGRLSFGEVFEFLPTATNSRADLDAAGDTYYIHYGDIHTRFHDHLNLRNQQPPRISRQKCRNAAYVCNGDWIMADASEDFDGVCKSVEVLGLSEGDKVVSGLHTFLLREKSPTFVPGFKGHLGNLKSLRDQYLRVLTGMKVFGVSKTALRDIALPIPKPKEQEAIVTILSDMEADICALEGSLAKARLIKQGMIQKLLTGGIRLI